MAGLREEFQNEISLLTGKVCQTLKNFNSPDTRRILETTLSEVMKGAFDDYITKLQQWGPLFAFPSEEEGLTGTCTTKSMQEPCYKPDITGQLSTSPVVSQESSRELGPKSSLSQSATLSTSFENYSRHGEVPQRNFKQDRKPSWSRTYATVLGVIMFRSYAKSNETRPGTSIFSSNTQITNLYSLSFTFVPKLWLFSNIPIASSSVGSTSNGYSIDYSLAWWNSTSQEAAIFQACRRGDLECMQQLFNSRQASIYDVADGLTILHVSPSFSRSLLLYFLQCV